jgi:hypothetical protein
MNLNQTVDLPPALGDIMGVYDSANWETVVLELVPDTGVLTRGTVLSTDVSGKLTASTAGNEMQAFGILLDPSIDTASAFSDGTVTASVARAGSFKGPALIVGVGTDPVKLTGALRQQGIYVEGLITVPATAVVESENAPAPTAGPTTQPPTVPAA